MPDDETNEGVVELSAEAVAREAQRRGMTETETRRLFEKVLTRIFRG